MSAGLAVAGVLAAAVLLGVVRLLRWQARTPAEQRVSPIRLAVLLLAQPLCATLLYFALFPPRGAHAPANAALAVLTADSTAAQLARARSAGEIVVALPEAAPALQAQVERQPDLATALRRHPGNSRVRVYGSGLEARDRDAATALALQFEPAGTVPGLSRLHYPRRLVPGQAFRIDGRAQAGARVELYDPAGRRLASAIPDPAGRFRFDADARAPGPAVFRLRLLDGHGAVLEQADVPLWIAAPPPPRVLLLAGAPNAETKYLRRWAEDAGIDLQTRIELGGGIRLGDAAALTPETLRRLDLLALDLRTLAGLDAGERAALRQALDAGLGVLLRGDGEPSATARAQLRAWGFADDGETATLPPGLPAAGDDATNAAAAPDIHLRRIRPVASDAAALLRDTEGRPLLYWRAQGRGRIGVWLPLDSWQWVLRGDAGRHGALWSQAFATLARATAAASPAIDGERIGERVSICPAEADARVLAPDDGATTLLPDPHSGMPACAGFWPGRAGWYRLRQGDATWPFYVRAAGDAPGLRRAERSEASRRLAGASRTATATADRAGQRGSSWPWLLAWLLCSGGLWWFERRRRR